MWIAYKTLVKKEFIRFARLWIQTIIPPAVTTSLYMIIFGDLIGDRIGTMQGVDYLYFIIPGIILMNIIMQSYANTVSSFFMAKYHHSIEELIVSPVPNWIIILGFISGGVARGFCVGVFVTFIVSFFIELNIHNYFILGLSFLLTAIMFSLAGLINGIFAKSFDDISIVPTFILLPLTYLGGVFYSIDILPSFWRSVSSFNPIFYMIDSFRLGFIGVGSANIYVSMLVPFITIIILTIFAIYLLKKGVNIKK